MLIVSFADVCIYLCCYLLMPFTSPIHYIYLFFLFFRRMCTHQRIAVLLAFGRTFRRVRPFPPSARPSKPSLAFVEVVCCCAMLRDFMPLSTPFPPKRGCSFLHPTAASCEGLMTPSTAENFLPPNNKLEHYYRAAIGICIFKALPWPSLAVA